MLLKRNLHVAFVATLLLVACLLLGAKPVHAADDSSKPYEVIDRLYGADRYLTADAIMKALPEYQGGFGGAVIAYGGDFADALSGTSLANAHEFPIMLTNSRYDSKVYNDVLSSVKAGGTIYIIGGSAVVSDTLESDLVAAGFNVKRLWGNNRYETNLAVLREQGANQQDFVVCSGMSYADALSAGAIGKPIMLVAGSLTPNQKEWMSTVNSTRKIFLIGGTGAVSSTVESQIRTAGKKIEYRISGANRYETSVGIAEYFFRNNNTTVVLASGTNFPDGLAGGALAYQTISPLLLTYSNTKGDAPEVVCDYVASRGALPENSYVLGGPAIISNATVNTIFGVSNEYKYEIAIIGDSSQPIYSGLDIPIFIRTDNPDGDTVDLKVEVLSGGAQHTGVITSYDNVNVLKDYGGDYKVDGGYFSVHRFDKPCKVRLTVREKADGQWISKKSVTIDVADYSKAYQAWINQVIAENTDSSMTPIEKMSAIESYFINESGFVYTRMYNDYYAFYIQDEMQPLWVLKQWNSFVSPGVLEQIANTIGGFEEVHNCYGDAENWYFNHHKCRVTYQGQYYYYTVCPFTDSNVVTEIEMFDFKGTDNIIVLK